MTINDGYLTKSQVRIMLLSLLVIGTNIVFLGCENPNMRKAEVAIKESAAKTGEAAKDLGTGISDETSYIIEEIKKGANVTVSEIKNGGILVSKKGEDLFDKTKEKFSAPDVTSEIQAKYANSPKFSGLHIIVSTVKDHVTLSGTVHNKEEIIEAINLALSVKSVKHVTSLLEVKN